MINKSLVVKNFERLKLRILQRVVREHVTAEQYQLLTKHYQVLLKKTTKVKVEMLRDLKKGEKKSTAKLKSTNRKAVKKIEHKSNDGIQLTRTQFLNLEHDEQAHLIKILTNPTASNKFRQDLAKYYLGLRKERPIQNAI